MARLWSAGFELQSATAGVEFDTAVGTAPTISTSTVRSGAASLRCNPTAATSYIQHRFRVDSTVRVFYRVSIRFATLPNADCVIMAHGDGSSFFPTIRFEVATGTLRVFDGADVAIGSSSAALSTGVWYRLEMDYADGNGSGDTTSAYLDGAAFATAVQGGDMFGGGVFEVGIVTAASADMFIDDIAINDTSGSAQTGLPGAGQIVHLWPDAAGDANGFATAVGGTAGASNNFTRVDEFPPDDATSYNNSTATGTTTIDDFNVTSSASAGIGASDTISVVQVGQRAGSSAVTAASIVTRIKGQASGTTTESASIPVNTTAFNTHATAVPKTYRLTTYLNPQTGTAWTSTSLDSMQIGYRGNVSQTTQRRITTLWALVEYVSAAATNAPAVEATAVAATPSAAVALGANADLASATATSPDATASLGANAAAATAAASAFDSTVTTSASPDAATASATGVAHDATVSTSASPTAGLAAATGAAPDASVAAGAPAGVATGAGAANDAAIAITVPAGTAAATAAALDATVSTAATVDAPAAIAIAAAQAPDAAAAIGVLAATATATGAGLDATVSTAATVDAPAAVATAAAQAFDATVAATVVAGVASAAGAALDAGVTVGALAPSVEALAAAAAFDATVSILVLAGTAAAGGQAFPATTPTTANITLRPFTGTTPRPVDGITVRPFAGVTPRP